MSRNLMPKSGAMAPYVVVNRDAAVAGVFSVDGEAGAVALTSKYLQISNYTIDKEELNTRLTGIDTRIDGVDTSIGSINESVGNINTALGGINTSIEDINTSIEGINTTLGEIDTSLEAKASKGANNDITELNALTKAITIAQGGTGSSTLEGAKTALELDRFSQESETETIIYSGDKNSRLTIQNSGIWGVYSDTEQKWLALPVEQGGTGVNNREALWGVVRPQGSTPLAGDPVGDYDAVTKRWVENKINTGTVGPTMNGVMNYGVGDFHLRDSRAYIQPYEVVSDGQLLNRADWPELWAYAQMLGPISDADWLANPNQRGKYSTGDGTTTFRVPDRNGVQTGSVAALFGRGDGGVSSSDGTILDSAAPNITGSFGRLVYASTGTIYETNTGTGAFSAVLSQAKYKRMAEISSVDATAATYPSGFEFFASNSSPVYGRGSTEVRPKAFTGVWVIRASGGFVAANTSWSVINGDATRPADGTAVDGGNVYSLYKVNNATEAEANFRARANIGGNYSARISVTNSTTQRSANLDFDETGKLTVPNSIVVNSVNSDFDGVCWADSADKVRWRMGINDASGNFKLQSYDASGAYRDTVVDIPGAGTGGVVWARDITIRPTTDGPVKSFVLHNAKDSVPAGNFRTMWDSVNINSNQIYKYFEKGNGTGITINWPSSGGVLALQGTSGRDFKKDIVDADVTEAVARIDQMRMVNYVYKDDVQERVRFGIIAEEAEAIAPQYIKHREETYDVEVDPETNAIIGGKTRDRPSVDVNPIVMDLMGCVQYLNKQIEDLKAEIAALKAAK